MSVNFGYGGYGMMNGINVGVKPIMNQGGSICQSVASQYNCPLCNQYGAVPYNDKLYVNPLPKRTANPSFITRIFRHLMGG